MVIAAAGAAMCYWSWGTWPDVLIDFGRELYVPWRIAAGSVLYVDIAYFNGPLSPYWNALWFRLFGASLLTLTVCNLVLLALLIALLYRLLADIGSRLSATGAGLALVALFGFGQFVGIGNYNFISPYSHELTHGLLLSIAALFGLSRYHQRRTLLPIAGVGFALGLLFLTKVEVFLAGALATITGLLLTLWVERPCGHRLLRLLGTFAGASAIPPATTFLLFWLAMPAGEALRQPLGHWLTALRSDLTALEFFRTGMGTDDIRGNVWALLTATFWYAALFGPPAALGLALRQSGKHRMALAAGCFVVAVAALSLGGREIAWLQAARPLPLFMLVAGLISLGALFRYRHNPEPARRLILQVSLIVLAEVMLMKIILNARIYHYGFALAMPATLLLVVALLAWVPVLIEGLGGYGPVFRATALGALSMAVVAHLSYVGAHIRQKTYIVGSGADAFRADVRGAFVKRALEEIRARARPDQTLAVFPEGIMINYLARRVNPTPYLFFGPFDMILSGENRILTAFRAHAPDYVILAHKDTSEYGFRFFGRDYGQTLYAWILDHYRPVALVGAPPLKDQRFGLLLMQLQDDR